MKKYFLITVLSLLSAVVQAKPVVNVYIWGGEIPKSLVHDFEQQTGIDVHFSTYDSNETLYAKLKASRSSIYDVVLPSAYFVERMRKQNMLTPLDHAQLPQLHHLLPQFRHHDYDQGNQYSVPLVWGITGLFYNQKNINPAPHAWKDLWDKRWRNQLMILDDARDVFAMGLMKIGYQPDDTNPRHIHEAYEALLALLPNIKLFANEGIQANMIDEDANMGIAWNGDVNKARAENPTMQFVYPKEGFVLWIDCLAIPKNPPHLHEAYAFINFMLEPEHAVQIALQEGHALTNQGAIKKLPLSLQQNPLLYPPAHILEKAHVQRDLGEEIMALYNQYWQTLKLSI